MKHTRAPFSKKFMWQLGSSSLIAISPALLAGGLTDSTRDLGVYTGTVIELNTTAPFKAFSDYTAAYQGWTHTTRYLTLTVGSAQDIATGKTFDLQLSMQGGQTLGNTDQSAIDNPAFALWTAGTGEVFPERGAGQHGWNPTRGPNETGINTLGNSDTLLINENFQGVGVLKGHEGWIGYANAGSEYTLINALDPTDPSKTQTLSGLPVLDAVSHGSINHSSKTWLTRPEASAVSYTNRYYLANGSMQGTAADKVTMNLYGLKAGNYWIATGGSCPELNPKSVCGIGTDFTFSVAPLSTSAPEVTALNTALGKFNLQTTGTNASTGQISIKSRNNQPTSTYTKPLEAPVTAAWATLIDAKYPPYYSAYPASTTEVATVATTEGISIAPYLPQTVKNVNIAYLLFKDSTAQLRQKALIPTPVNFDQLSAALSAANFKNISQQADGIIQVTSSDGQVYKLLADYMVYQGPVPANKQLSFAITHDLNGDGLADVTITYANGEQQTLLLVGTQPR